LLHQTNDFSNAAPPLA